MIWSRTQPRPAPSLTWIIIRRRSDIRTAGLVRVREGGPATCTSKLCPIPTFWTICPRYNKSAETFEFCFAGRFESKCLQQCRLKFQQSKFNQVSGLESLLFSGDGSSPALESDYWQLVPAAWLITIIVLEEIRREDQQLWGGGGESSTSPHVRREHPESDIVKIIHQKRRVQVPQLIMPSWTWNITECRCLNECHDFDVLLLKRIKSYFFNFDDNKLFFYYYIGLWRDSWCLLRSRDRLSIPALALVLCS